jgi:hypothetical protein
MSNTPWHEQGSYIAFPLPIDAITDDPVGSPDWGLCLTAAWQPAVLGALKVLCRPETWVGTDADIKTACHNAYRILQAVQEPCNAAPAAIPFACGGALFDNPQPFGVFAYGFNGNYPCGDYLGGYGYHSASCFVGGIHYNGVWIHIDLGAQYTINDMLIVYNYGQGCRDHAGSLGRACYDPEHGYFIGPYKTQETMVDGSGITWHAGSHAGTSRYIDVGVWSDNWDGGACPNGGATITRIDVSGSYPVGGAPPC